MNIIKDESIDTCPWFTLNRTNECKCVVYDRAVRHLVVINLECPLHNPSDKKDAKT